MSEKQFTNVSIGMEEAYCDFSIIKVGDKIISDRIPTTDAIRICYLLNELNDENKELKKEKEQLKQKLECCEYSHFLNELDEIHKKIDKGDYSDFKPLKQEEKDKQIEKDYARLQRRKILERSGNCKPLTLKYNPKYFTLKIWGDDDE